MTNAISGNTLSLIEYAAVSHEEFAKSSLANRELSSSQQKEVCLALESVFEGRLSEKIKKQLSTDKLEIICENFKKLSVNNIHLFEVADLSAQIFQWIDIRSVQKLRLLNKKIKSVLDSAEFWNVRISPYSALKNCRKEANVPSTGFEQKALHIYLTVLQNIRSYAKVLHDPDLVGKQVAIEIDKAGLFTFTVANKMSGMRLCTSADKKEYESLNWAISQQFSGGKKHQALYNAAQNMSRFGIATLKKGKIDIPLFLDSKSNKTIDRIGYLFLKFFNTAVLRNNISLDNLKLGLAYEKSSLLLEEIMENVLDRIGQDQKLQPLASDEKQELVDTLLGAVCEEEIFHKLPLRSFDNTFLEGEIAVLPMIDAKRYVKVIQAEEEDTVSKITYSILSDHLGGYCLAYPWSIYAIPPKIQKDLYKQYVTDAKELKK